MTANGHHQYCVLRIVKEFTPVVGGSVTHIIELSKNINPYLKKQFIIAPYYNNCEGFDNSFPIPIIRVKYPNLCHGCPIINDFIYSIYAKKIIKKIIKENNINIIHIHSPFLSTYLIPQIRSINENIGIIVMVHGWIDKKSREYGISYRFGKLLISLFPPDRYLILDDGSQFFELTDILDKRKIPWDIVYHAIDVSRFTPILSDESSNDFIILFPHRPVKIKNPDIAMEIFNDFYRSVKNPMVHLIYLASNQQIELKEKAKEMNIDKNIIFSPALSGDSLIKCINRSSVVIGTSLNSNNGRAILEAMACARPVIAFNNGNISNLIVNTENGMLIEPGDIDAFVRSLEILFYDSLYRKKLGRCARESIIEKRSWEKRLLIELSVYNTVHSK